MKKKEQKNLYNDIAREKFERVIEQNGMKIKFVAEKAGIEYTTLSKWRNRSFDFYDDKLSKIEGFISKY